MNSPLSRRGFLALSGQGVIGGLALVAGESLLGCRPSRLIPIEPTPTQEAAKIFNRAEWQILKSVQDHLLPSGPNSPGAHEVNATGYLDAALQGADIEPGEIAAIRAGIISLSEISEKSAKRRFVELSRLTREQVLRDFEHEKSGEAWLQLVLSYTLEAYLGDPVYGGNPDDLVWKWLEHSPGEPRPTLVQLGHRR